MRMNVLLVDDHPAIRRSTRDILDASEIDVNVIETGTLEGARASLLKTPIDTVVFDIELPDGNGSDLLTYRETSPENDRHRPHPSGFICLTMHTDIHTVLRTITNGADAFLSKESPPEEIVTAIRAIANGHSYVCNRTTKVLTTWIQEHPDLSDTLVDSKYHALSPKEKQVFRLLAEGYDTAGIAELLSVSKKTVANYRLKIFGTLGISSLRELRVYAQENAEL